MTAPNPTQVAEIIIGEGISEEEKTKRINRVSLITSLLCLVLGIAVLVAAYTERNARIMIPAVALILTFLLQILLSQNLFIKNNYTKTFVLTLSFSNVLVIFALFFTGTALPVAGTILIFALMCSITILDGDRADTLLPVALMFAIFGGILGTYPTIEQYSIPFFMYFMVAGFAILLITFIGLVGANLISINIGVKITITALCIVIAPLAILTLITSTFLRNTLLTETENSLINSTRLVSSRLDEFIQTNRSSIASEASLPLFSKYLALDMGQRRGSAQEKQLVTAIASIKAAMKVDEIAFLDSIKLLDRNGFIVYSTRASEIGANEKNRSFYDMPAATGNPYDSPVEFSPSDSKPYLYFSQAVKDSENQIVGVLVISYHAGIIQNYAKAYAVSNSEDSYPIILDENGLRIADPVNENLLYTLLAPVSDDSSYLLRANHRLPNQSLSTITLGLPDLSNRLNTHSKETFFTTEVAPDGKSYYTNIKRMTGQNWYVAYVRDEMSVAQLLENQSRLSIIIAALIAGAISMLSTYIAQVLSKPILILTQTAQQVSAGNLEARSEVISRDEFGILANAFNNMTGQLQLFITSLEDRVQVRTRELAERNDALTFRARQLETIAEVARSVTQTQTLEDVLNQVTHLISERFNFYHVGVFLVDETRKYAVLRAANSEGGQHMLARNHRLEVGQTGIVGYATATGQARIATDVGQDAVFFNNPDLPLTRSEMALPLMTGDAIIGALDVQSTQSNAFSEEDIQLFKILADQVALAIYNNRLFLETRQALHEAQVVHQRYLQNEWNRELAHNQHTAYRYSPAGVSALTKEQTSDLCYAPEEVITTEENGQKVLAVPVKLRGETIGAIRIQDEGQHTWAEDEILTVQAVADQVALALENARLFNETTRKAERERRVLEITSRIRSTNDPQAMMRIAVEELQRTLQTSRAQVVLQPTIPAASGPNGKNGSNGHHPDQNHQDQA